MFEKFLSLEPEKQERMLNAAMKEFAQRGFKNASTNEIVTEAGISKGLLFHYFHNKKELYLFVYGYVLDLLVREFFDKIDLNETDLLARLQHYSQLKVEIIQKHPEMFSFALSAVREEAPEVKPELESRNQAVLADNQARLFEGIDHSLFKEDIDIPKAIHVILWTLEGISAREKAKVAASALDSAYYDQILEEMDAYLALFKQAFYK